MVEEQPETMLKKYSTESSFLVHPDSDCESNEEFQVTSEIESKEPKICGRCSEKVVNLFYSETCDHEICVDCRFKDSVQCIFCSTKKTEETDSIIKTDISLPYSYVKKKLINKDHIIDVEQEGDKSVAKQICTVCQRVFLKTNARYHYACASGERPLKCTECSQRFVKKSHLESHMNSHFGIKPFKCAVPKCKASFSQKDKLVRHMKSHSSEKHMCTVCDKTYTSQPILQFHMEKVHSTAKLFKCDLCPRTYKYRRTLTVHRLKHQELKEHLCDICGKKYTVAAQLKQHKRSHVPISRRPFKCRRHHCKQRFMTRHDKARHELIHDHSSSPDFECSLCNTTFGRKDNLERHMKNFHQEPWNLEQSVKVTAGALPSNVKKSNLGNTISVNLNKTNKYARKKHKHFSDNCTKDISMEKVCKKRVKSRNKKHFNCPVDLSETVKTSETTNSREKLNQPKINHVKTVIVRPSVIKNVPKIQPLIVLPLDEKCQNTSGNNFSNPPVTNTSFTSNISTNTMADKLIDIVNYKPPYRQNETKTALSCNDQHRPFKIIRHTNSLMMGSPNNESIHNDDFGYKEDNIKSIVYKHCHLNGNSPTRFIRENVQSTSVRPNNHLECNLSQFSSHHEHRLPFNQNDNLPRFFLQSHDPPCSLYAPPMMDNKSDRANNNIYYGRKPEKNLYMNVDHSSQN